MHGTIHNIVKTLGRVWSTWDAAKGETQTCFSYPSPVRFGESLDLADVNRRYELPLGHRKETSATENIIELLKFKSSLAWASIKLYSQSPLPKTELKVKGFFYISNIYNYLYICTYLYIYSYLDNVTLKG